MITEGKLTAVFWNIAMRSNQDRDSSGMCKAVITELALKPIQQRPTASTAVGGVLLGAIA